MASKKPKIETVLKTRNATIEFHEKKKRYFVKNNETSRLSYPMETLKEAHQYAKNLDQTAATETRIDALLQRANRLKYEIMMGIE